MIPLKFPRAALSPWPSGERFFADREKLPPMLVFLVRPSIDRKKLLPSLGIFWRRDAFSTPDFFGKDAFSTLDFRERCPFRFGLCFGR